MRIATFVYGRILSSNGLQQGLWALARKLLLRVFGDLECRLQIHGKLLALPLSHSLPTYLKSFELYDRLPRRVASYLRTRHGGLRCIDVGANIGDSLAAFEVHENDLFVAVEPNPLFRRFLERNWGDDSRVRISAAVCSASKRSGLVHFSTRNGTASLMTSEEGTPAAFETVDDLALLLPASARVNLIKTDTDGHDFCVLAGADRTISEESPAILFECDSFGSEHYVEECISLLTVLRGHGYRGILVYDNFGWLIGRFSLDCIQPLKQLLFYQLTSPFHYFDLLVMHEDDLASFHRSEVRFFADRITNASLRDQASEAALFQS